MGGGEGMRGGEGKRERWGNLTVQGGGGGVTCPLTLGDGFFIYFFTVYNILQFLPTYVWSWSVFHWSLSHSFLNWSCAVVAV